MPTPSAAPGQGGDCDCAVRFSSSNSAISIFPPFGLHVLAYVLQLFSTSFFVISPSFRRSSIRLPHFRIPGFDHFVPESVCQQSTIIQVFDLCARSSAIRR